MSDPLSACPRSAEEESVLTIDPGQGGTGIALWDKLEFDKECALPFLTASFVKKDAHAFYQVFEELVKRYNVKSAFIENAHYHGSGSAKGQMVAQSGALVVLAKFIGGAEAILWRAGVSVRVVDVMEWKGQLPKEVVNMRILRVWPDCSATNHDWDAVGIGMWAQGMINNQNNRQR